MVLFIFVIIVCGTISCNTFSHAGKKRDLTQFNFYLEKSAISGGKNVKTAFFPFEVYLYRVERLGTKWNTIFKI